MSIAQPKSFFDDDRSVNIDKSLQHSLDCSLELLGITVWQPRRRDCLATNLSESWKQWPVLQSYHV